MRTRQQIEQYLARKGHALATAVADRGGTVTEIQDALYDAEARNDKKKLNQLKTKKGDA